MCEEMIYFSKESPEEVSAVTCELLERQEWISTQVRRREISAEANEVGNDSGVYQVSIHHLALGLTETRDSQSIEAIALGTPSSQEGALGQEICQVSVIESGRFHTDFKFLATSFWGGCEENSFKGGCTVRSIEKLSGTFSEVISPLIQKLHSKGLGRDINSDLQGLKYGLNYLLCRPEIIQRGVVMSRGRCGNTSSYHKQSHPLHRIHSRDGLHQQGRFRWRRAGVHLLMNRIHDFQYLITKTYYTRRIKTC